jgi:hypothetical protein
MRGSTFNVAERDVNQNYYIAAAIFIVVIVGIFATMALKSSHWS